jgi:hypothetical protein
MTGEAREALERARARLDRLELYPRPLRIDRVRILTVPIVFRLPRMRRYAGYALWRTILLRRPPARGATDDLITHELCHIWQMQNRPLHVLFKFLTTGYRENPYEREARRAVEETRVRENGSGRASSSHATAKEESVDINPRPDDATDPMSEGDIDDPDEVDTEEREEGDEDMSGR